MLTDDTFLILFNASWNPQVFTLPPFSSGTTSVPVLDTTQASGSTAPGVIVLGAGSEYSRGARSLLVLLRP